MYDWELNDDMIDLWLFMMNIMIIRLEIQWNKNWERVGEKGQEHFGFERKQVIFEDESFESFPSWVFGFSTIKFQKDFVCFQTFQIRKMTFS